MYPTYNYPLNLNCYASFRTIYSHGKQELKFEVVEGRMAADAFIAFGNDYGDTETHSDITGLTKTQEVPSNKENRRRIMMHFNTGTNTPDQGFLAKITVRDL